MNIHITLLGKTTLPVYYPIIKFEQDIIHVIYTNENKDIEQQFEKVLIAKGKTVEKHLVNAFNPVEVLNVCENIHLSAKNEDVFLYNITGGNKIMAFAAYSVALKNKAKVIYNTTTSVIDMTTFESFDLKLVLSNEDIFLLQGQILKDYIPINTIDSDKVQSAMLIMQFILKHNDSYKIIQKEYSKNHGSISNIFHHGNLAFSWKDHRINIKKNDDNLLSFEHPDAIELLFEGRWWETIIAHEINKWSAGRFEIWCDVRFKPQNIDRFEIDKNEIDILVNIGNTLLFVECKSGYVTQDNIYKSKIIRDTYGGDKSKSILVSFYPIKLPNLEKAKESEVKVLSPNYVKGGKDVITKINSFFENILKQFNL